MYSHVKPTIGEHNMNKQAYERMVGMVLNKEAADIGRSIRNISSMLGRAYDKVIPQGGLLGRRSHKQLNAPVMPKIKEHRKAVNFDRLHARHMNDLMPTTEIIKPDTNINIRNGITSAIRQNKMTLPEYNVTGARFVDGKIIPTTNHNKKLDIDNMQDAYESIMFGKAQERSDISRKVRNRVPVREPHMYTTEASTVAARLNTAKNRQYTEDEVRKALFRRQLPWLWHNAIKPLGVTALGAAGAKEVYDQVTGGNDDK